MKAVDIILKQAPTLSAAQFDYLGSCFTQNPEHGNDYYNAIEAQLFQNIAWCRNHAARSGYNPNACVHYTGVLRSGLQAALFRARACQYQLSIDTYIKTLGIITRCPRIEVNRHLIQDLKTLADELPEHQRPKINETLDAAVPHSSSGVPNAYFLDIMRQTAQMMQSHAQMPQAAPPIPARAPIYAGHSSIAGRHIAHEASGSSHLQAPVPPLSFATGHYYAPQPAFPAAPPPLPGSHSLRYTTEARYAAHASQLRAPQAPLPIPTLPYEPRHLHVQGQVARQWRPPEGYSALHTIDNPGSSAAAQAPALRVSATPATAIQTVRSVAPRPPFSAVIQRPTPRRAVPGRPEEPATHGVRFYRPPTGPDGRQ